MLFSVLIPVYNTSKYLEECVESVLSQSENDFEIVLVNDGSTDNSGAMCDSYAQKYPDKIRVIHKDNEGLMMTRRRGFKEAKGDYCICLDSDDYLCDNNAFKKIKKMIVENGCDMIVFDYFMEKESRDKDKTITLFDVADGYVFEGKTKRVVCEKLLIGGFFNCIFAKVAKRSIIDLDVDYTQWMNSLYKSQGEDVFQSLPIIDRAQKIGYVKSTLYFYRWNNGSISRNYQLEYYHAYRTLCMRELEYMKKWGFTDIQIATKKLKRFDVIISIFTNCFLNCKDKKNCYEFFDKVADDEFYKELTDFDDKKKVLLYYRMVNFCIIHKQHWLLSIIVNSVSKLSDIRHKIKK